MKTDITLLSDKLVIGTRGSQLALWQANWVKAQLQGYYPDLHIDLEIITTTGDRVQHVSLPKLGEQGKGLFTKEIEDAILERRVDLAVHSLKDLPTALTPGLHIGAICEREDVRDALVAREGIRSFDDLPERARIGTSSLRRQAQVQHARPDLIVEPMRGNVDTRLRKLDSGEYDAIILAAAGLRRLGRADCITEYLSEELVLPAVGQGAIAIETRQEDPETNRLIRALNHEETWVACEAERAFLKGLGGGCLVPIAALARVRDETLTIKGLVARPDGSEIAKAEKSGSSEDAAVLGQRLAEEMLAGGAGRLLTR